MSQTAPQALHDRPASQQTRFSHERRPDPAKSRQTPFSQAVEIQRRLLDKIRDKETGPLALASLSRAWCDVEDRKRILRGIPLPGQLRPDLDPMQLLKAIKRSRDRKPLELGSGSNGSSFVEEEPEPETTSAPTEKPEEKGISLNAAEGGDGVRGRGGKTPLG